MVTVHSARTGTAGPVSVPAGRRSTGSTKQIRPLIAPAASRVRPSTWTAHSDRNRSSAPTRSGISQCRPLAGFQSRTCG